MEFAEFWRGGTPFFTADPSDDSDWNAPCSFSLDSFVWVLTQRRYAPAERLKSGEAEKKGHAMGDGRASLPRIPPLGQGGTCFRYGESWSFGDKGCVLPTSQTPRTERNIDLWLRVATERSGWSTVSLNADGEGAVATQRTGQSASLPLRTSNSEVAAETPIACGR